jgi:FHS family glucose/mannose:H+ symporter-like MFS transporter
MPRQSDIGLIYVIGLVQGLALVTFPAASSVFIGSHGFGFGASRYGMMFIPQVALAILASSIGPAVARRSSLKRVLQGGLAADVIAMTLLAVSELLIDRSDAAYGVLLVATGSLGAGFGAAVMAMNAFAQRLSPGREDRSVLTLNALLGAGTALAPLFAAIVIGAGAWWTMPVIVAVALTVLLVLTTARPLDASAGAASDALRLQHLPRRFWLFAAAVFLYGIAETLNGNWSGPYLTGEHAVSVRGASLALMTFWGMVTIGRVLFAMLSTRSTVARIYAGLPILLAVAFQIVARARGETAGIAAFGLAGLGCSAFFPLSISLSGREFPQLAAVMSGQLVAVYQAGYGVAAFGVGPLRQFADVSFATIYSLGSLVASAMLVVAFGVTTRRPDR